MGGFITLRRQGLLFFERRIPDRLGFPPLLNAFRPANLRSLITRTPYRVIGDGEEPTLSLHDVKDVVANPIFQAKSKLPLLSGLR